MFGHSPAAAVTPAQEAEEEMKSSTAYGDIKICRTTMLKVWMENITRLQAIII